MTNPRARDLISGPDVVKVNPAGGEIMRFSPAALRAVQKVTGRTFTQLTDDDADEITRFQVIAFCDIYRREAWRAHVEHADPPDADEIWERAELADVILETPADFDPKDAASWTASPRSAGTGT